MSVVENWDIMRVIDKVKILKSYPIKVALRLAKMKWKNMNWFEQWHVIIAYNARDL